MEEANPAKTPAEVKQISIKEKDVLTPDRTTYFRAATGSLLYLSRCARPDLALIPVMILSRSMSSPGKRAMMRLKRVLRYLRGTTNLNITYKNGIDDDNDRLVGYVDADHAGDPDEGYSTTGYVFYFAGGPLYWKSQRQTIVTLSTVEAEYVALSKGGQECVYLRDLMSSAGFERAQATTMHEDNSGALKLANTDHYHPRTKHWCQVSLHQAPRQGERSCCGENIYG